ncbi:MAG: OmpA family protein [Bacteroidota bacterium]
MKKIVLIISLVAFSTAYAQRIDTSPISIYFAKDSYILTESSEKVLDSLLATITDPSEELLLVGHTDSDADLSYNKTLSLNRTRIVQAYLFDRNVQNRIHIDWQGETRPLNSNKDEKEKTLNRRVEIVRNYRGPKNQLEKLTKPAEVFMIDPSRDTILVCKEGTQILIRAGSFVTEDPTSPVEIKVTEFYKKSDFILNNLTTTTTENELLESGGTIDIRASAGNKQLELKQGASLQVLFKDKKADDGMEAYYAREGETVTKWSTNTPPGTNAGEPILISKSFKIQNMDTMQIVSELILNIGGLHYKAIKTEKRGRPSDPMLESMSTSLLDPQELTRSIFFSPDRAITVRATGRINCDRLLIPENSRVVNIEVPGDKVPSLSIALDTNNLIIPYSRRENNVFIFDNVPMNAKFNVLGIYLDDSGIYFGQLKNIVLSDSQKNSQEYLSLNMKRCTENELRAAVQEIDEKRSK